MDQEFDRDGPALDSVVTDNVEELWQLWCQPVPHQLSLVAGPFIRTSYDTTDKLPHGSSLVSVVDFCAVHLGEIAIDDRLDQVKDTWTKKLR